MQHVSDKISIQEIDTLNSEAWLLNRKDPVKAIELSKNALTLAQKKEYTLGKALALKTLGAANVWISKNQDALQFSFEAIALFAELGDKKNEAETNYNVGANFRYISDYDSAIKYYNNCYNISKEIGDELGMADGLNGLGTVYYGINENHKALDVLLESQKLCLKHNNKEIYIKVLDGIGEAYYNLKNYNEALIYYIKCASMSNELGSKQVEAFALDGLGRTYAALQKDKEAIQNFDKSLAVRREIGFKAGEVISLLNKGVFLVEKGELEAGIELLLQSRELATSINSKEGVYKASEKMALAYEKLGDYKKAIDYYKEFSATRDEVITETTAQVVRSVEMQHKMLQSQAEKTTLEQRAIELESYSENLVLLGEIGQKIISQLHVGDIVETVYDSVNKLMDAAGFGIGLFDSRKNQIQFPLFMEGGEKFNEIIYDLSDREKLSTICFSEQKEIVINDFDLEIKNYVNKKLVPTFGKVALSLVYLPLIVKQKTVGVITVQSFSKNAYNNYHINILRNLASYTAIALDNARLYQEQEAIIETRTAEVVAKKEEVEKAYQNNKLLSQLGQQITSAINLEEIFSKLNSYVAGLMDAGFFGVRLYDAERQIIDYKYGIENGIRNPPLEVSMDNKDNYSVWCVTNKKDIFINDNEKEYKKYTKKIVVVTGDMPHSLIFSPIMINDRVLGCITVQSFKRNAYSDYHLDILKTLATYSAIALENASLFELLEEKVQRRTFEVVKQKEEVEKTYNNTKLLSEIGNEITSLLSVKDIVNNVYSSVNNLMDASGFGIGVVNYTTHRIEFPLYIEGDDKFDSVYYDINEPDKLSCICFNGKKDIIINDFKSEIEHYVGYVQPPLQGRVVESIIYLPLKLKEKVLGVITVQSFRKNAYTSYQVEMLRSLAVYVAIAIDNASLYNNLEDRVIERTKEIEKNYNDTRLIGEIAKELSSSLSVETIISSVHKNLNQLMKTDSFGIGIYNDKDQSLEFKGFRENQKIIDDFKVDVNDQNRLGAICYKNKMEIVINDFVTESSKYIKLERKPILGNDNMSVVYLPLYSKNETIGVITVQSLDKNAYSNYHVNILKNLAVSIGISLDNASLYEHLEEKVEERTMEVVKQKEEIERTYENTRILSEIGNDITSTLSVAEIIEKVYENVNSLMDATGFGIGVFKEDTNQIIYPVYIEGEDKFENIVYEKEDENRLTNVCFYQNRVIVINNYLKDIKHYISNYMPPLKGQSVESIIYLPLILKEKKLGVITVQSFKRNRYSNYHVQILKNLAVYVAIAIDNASLYENLEHRVIERTKEVTKQKERLEKNFNDTKLVAQISKLITSSLSVETIVSVAYEHINGLMSAESFGIGLHNESTQSIQFPGFIERSVKMPYFEFFLKDKNRFAVWSFENEKEILINDLHKEYNKYIKDLAEPVAGDTPLSIIYMPLYTKEKKIGVITVQSFSKNAYSEYQLNILRNLANSVAIALENAALYENLEEKVKVRTEEVFRQKAIIEEKNKDITDSIQYAKKIQLALMTETNLFNETFKESFVYFKPKDIVSGDFYWATKKMAAVVNEKGVLENHELVYLAVCDSTGHGVPGAFMSLLNISFLNEAINEKNLITPNDVFNYVRQKLINNISKEGQKDGFDGTLLCINKTTNEVTYSSSFNAPILVSDENFVELDTDRMPVGYGEKQDKFSLKKVTVKKGDKLYLYTDGYADQFGGPRGKKFMSKKLNQFIQSISAMPLLKQAELFGKNFEDWKGNLEQIDDVCIIGLKF